jgi:hypothetical protein
MLESQRQDILTSMGLKVLQPRFQLLGAKASVVLIEEQKNTEEVLTVVADEKIKEPVSAVSQETAQAGPAVMPSSLFGGLQEAAKPSASVNKKPTAEAIKYRHRLLRFGELMMIIDQPSVEWHDANSCKSFFADVYFALTEKKPEYYMDAQFDWPPSKHFPYANDKDMSQQALQAFIQEHLQQVPCKWILLWGGNVRSSTFDLQLAVGETEFLHNVPVLQLDTYQEYWQSPFKKAMLWQYLQAIKKSLAKNA